MTNGRWLGIDYGDQRIGLAMSDATAMLASPLEVLAGGPIRKNFERIGVICREKKVVGIIVGLPMRLDGTDTPATTKARQFAEDLKSHVTVGVTLWDERFTTVSAENSLIEGGMRREKRRQIIDMVAAQILLQSFLDSHSSIPPNDESD